MATQTLSHFDHIQMEGPASVSLYLSVTQILCISLSSRSILMQWSLTSNGLQSFIRDNHNRRTDLSLNLIHQKWRPEN